MQLPRLTLPPPISTNFPKTSLTITPTTAKPPTPLKLRQTYATSARIRSTPRDAALSTKQRQATRLALAFCGCTKPSNDAEAFLNPDTRQDRYVPFERTGDIYLQALDIVDPALKRQIALGKLTILEATERVRVPRKRHDTDSRVLALNLTMNQEIVLADKSIQHHLQSKRLTLSDALEIDLTRHNLDNLRNKLLRRYLQSGYLSVMECIKLDKQQIETLVEDAMFKLDPIASISALVGPATVSSPDTPTSSTSSTSSDSDSESSSDLRSESDSELSPIPQSTPEKEAS